MQDQPASRSDRGETHQTEFDIQIRSKLLLDLFIDVDSYVEHAKMLRNV